MPRRLTALLVMVLVLLGTVAPTLACAAALSTRDCCPEGSTTPCGGEGSGTRFNGLVEACCLSAPQASPAWVSASREQTERQSSHSGSPDPVVAVAWLLTLSHQPHTHDLPTLSAVAIPGDGVLTYLRTGRLRL